MASVAKRTWTYKGAEKTAWVVRYVDAGGVHRQKTFDKKKDADLYRSDVESLSARGLHRPEAETMRLDTVATEFVRHLEQRQRSGQCGKTHVRRVSVFIRLHILPFIGHAKLADLNLSLLTHWNRDLLQARKISPYTARNAAQVLKMILDFAERRDWIVKNPALQLLSDLRGIQVERIRTFSREEIVKLLETAAAPSYQGRRPRAHLFTQCAVHLAAFCGLRLGEILGLKATGVDFANGLIRIRSSLSRHDGLKGPKSAAGVRDVGMPEHVADLLRAWMSSFGVSNGDGLVFTRTDGQPMRTDTFRHGSWGPLLRRAGLTKDATRPEYHFHALRHFAASWRVDAGWNIADVARQMGHSTFDMTLGTYTHALDGGGAKSAETQALVGRLMSVPPLALPAPLAQGLRTAA